MLIYDVTQPSTIAHGHLLLKRNTLYSFCVEYQKLNAIAHKDAYPLLHIDNTQDIVSGSR